MSTATLRLHYRAIQNKVTSIQAIKINWKLLYFLAFMCSLAMLVFYVFGVNQLIQGTYLIKNYNKEIKNLLAENRSLEVVGTEASFLGLTPHDYSGCRLPYHIRFQSFPKTEVFYLGRGKNLHPFQT